VIHPDVSPSQPQHWQQNRGGVAPPQNPTIPEGTEPVELDLDEEPAVAS